MKKIFSIVFALSIVAPAFAFAQSLPIGPTPLQLLTAVAAIEAQEQAIQSNAPLACTALFSSQTVAVGQPIALAWGSYGAVSNASSSQSTYTPEGATYVTLDHAGTWTYSFRFYGAGGSSTSCSAKILAQ